MREFKGCKNYTLVNKEWLSDVGAYGYILTHDKTGARVCLISNEDDNKVFVIGFRTIPEDSTGVAHILEHSVLCGSDNFPVKDAMTEVSKGSLNTFLNAFTYPDRTLYPVASVNEKDFSNLMHVYLDAVFNPRVHSEEKTFLQEGWHYELESEDAELKINGVVYNEMKGAYSSPQDVCGSYTWMSLFPDTVYGNESGGDPKVIPELKYEDFLAFHKRMYHPSNARIYLYGDTDFEEKLEFIDREYLSKYERINPDTDVTLQDKFDKPLWITKEYSVVEKEEEKDNTFLTYNVCCADYRETEIIDAMNVINYALVSVPGAKLKERLIDAGIGKDVYSTLSTDCGQKQFSIIAEGANSEDEEKFVSIIEDTIKEIIKEGFDKKTLLASISTQEFSYREADFGFYPRGLIYGMLAFESWNYSDEDTFQSLKQNAVFKELKEKLEGDYFEKVLEERVLNNTHKTILKVVPVCGLQKKEDDELKAKLAQYKATLSKDEIAKIVEETKALKAYQEAEDTPEALSTIPTLSISDIPKEGKKFDYSTKVIDDVTFVNTEQFTNNIAYVKLSFTMDKVPYELLPYVGICKLLFAQVDTKKYRYGELVNEIGIVTGGLNVNTTVYKNAYDSDIFDACFEAKFKTLVDKREETLALAYDILFESIFEDKKRIKDILEETKTRIQGYNISSGHTVSYQRVNSYTGKSGVVAEYLSGMDQYRTIEKLLVDYDASIDGFIEKMKEALSYILAKENLTVAISADKESIAKFEDAFSDFLKNIPSKKLEKAEYNFEPEKKQEAYTSASQVQYVALGGNFFKAGLEYTGSLAVMRNILSTDYLWTAVRLQGGAYGAMCSFPRNGEAFMVSYRDPNLEKTVRAYEGAYEYIKNYSADAKQVERFVISTIGDVDTPFTPSLIAQRTFIMYMDGITNEMTAKERKEILSTDVDTIRGLSTYIKAILDQGCIACVGSKEAIEGASEFFKNIEPLCNS